uniref:Uncharacterized protein n=1 Tax=Arundo donax TaxID=35708 RepID=A0A0A9DVC0_ARUDO
MHSLKTRPTLRPSQTTHAPNEVPNRDQLKHTQQELGINAFSHKKHPARHILTFPPRFTHF